MNICVLGLFCLTLQKDIRLIIRKGGQRMQGGHKRHEKDSGASRLKRRRHFEAAQGKTRKKTNSQLWYYRDCNEKEAKGGGIDLERMAWRENSSRRGLHRLMGRRQLLQCLFHGIYLIYIRVARKRPTPGVVRVPCCATCL